MRPSGRTKKHIAEIKGSPTYHFPVVKINYTFTHPNGIRSTQIVRVGNHIFRTSFDAAYRIITYKNIVI